MNPYRPSNGTEGDIFMSQYCYQCLHEHPDPDVKTKCDIMTSSMVFGIDEPGYPKEWVIKDGCPTCLKFQKWDWGTNGDPNDPDNPNKPPDPPDPAQMNLFPLSPKETDFEVIEPKKQTVS